MPPVNGGNDDSAVCPGRFPRANGETIYGMLFGGVAGYDRIIGIVGAVSARAFRCPTRNPPGNRCLKSSNCRQTEFLTQSRVARDAPV